MAKETLSPTERQPVVLAPEQVCLHALDIISDIAGKDVIDLEERSSDILSIYRSCVRPFADEGRSSDPDQFSVTGSLLLVAMQEKYNLPNNYNLFSYNPTAVFRLLQIVAHDAGNSITALAISRLQTALLPIVREEIVQAFQQIDSPLHIDRMPFSQFANTFKFSFDSAIGYAITTLAEKRACAFSQTGINDSVDLSILHPAEHEVDVPKVMMRRLAVNMAHNVLKSMRRKYALVGPEYVPQYEFKALEGANDTCVLELIDNGTGFDKVLLEHGRFVHGCGSNEDGLHVGMSLLQDELETTYGISIRFDNLIENGEIAGAVQSIIVPRVIA